MLRNTSYWRLPRSARHTFERSRHHSRYAGMSSSAMQMLLTILMATGRLLLVLGAEVDREVVGRSRLGEPRAWAYALDDVAAGLLPGVEVAVPAGVAPQAGLHDDLHAHRGHPVTDLRPLLLRLGPQEHEVVYAFAGGVEHRLVVALALRRLAHLEAEVAEVEGTPAEELVIGVLAPVLRILEPSVLTTPVDEVPDGDVEHLRVAATAFDRVAHHD